MATGLPTGEWDVDLSGRGIALPERRFPPPWSVEELNDAYFVVIDSAGQKLAFVYYEEEPGRRFPPGVAF